MCTGRATAPQVAAAQPPRHGGLTAFCSTAGQARRVLGPPTQTAPASHDPSLLDSGSQVMAPKVRVMMMPPIQPRMAAGTEAAPQV